MPLLPPLVSPGELRDALGDERTGRDDARLYDGSLTEWSAHPDLPLVTG